jgi:hypothetical protein
MSKFFFLVSGLCIIYEEFTEEGQRLARKGKKREKNQSEIASGTEGLRRSSLVRVFGIGDRDGQKSVSLARSLARSLTGVISLGLALRG